jgi:tripartite-type tricarboxylate transporter receptor subunit TctC
MLKSRRSAFLFGTSAGLLAPSVAFAQSYPSRAITLVVANSVGAPPDIVARAMAPEMSKALGQPVVVLPKPGGDERIASAYVAKEMPPDGYQVAVLAPANLATIPLLVKEPGFDALNDLVPITELVRFRIFLAGPTKQPWKTFNEMTNYAKANPGKLNYGAISVSQRMRIEAAIRARGVKMTFVPYTSNADMFQALESGEVQMTLCPDSIIAIKDKVIPLVVTGPKRYSDLPDVPVPSDLKLPPIPGGSYSFSVRAGTPQAIVQRLAAASSAALQDPGVRAQIEKLGGGTQIINNTPAQAKTSLMELNKLFADVGKQMGVQPQ